MLCSRILTRTPRLAGFNILHDFDAPPSRAEFNAHCRKVIEQDADARREIATLREDVLIFGHSHLQFHASIDGKLLVNPGGVGQPCDLDPMAAYTILDYSDGGWTVAERRVGYDIEASISYIKQTKMYAAARVWCELNFYYLREGRDISRQFFGVAAELNGGHAPGSGCYPDEIWNRAFEFWKEKFKQK